MKRLPSFLNIDRKKLFPRLWIWLLLGLFLLSGGLLLAQPSSSQVSFQFNLPVLQRNFPPNPISVESAWTTDISGTLKTDFTEGELVGFHGRGENAAAVPVQADLTWSVRGTCPETVIYTQTLLIEPGPFTATITQAAPDCSGNLSYRFEASYFEQPLSASASLSVTNVVSVTESTAAAFDKCQYPSLSQLETWRAQSPYSVVNIYIGGISRGCNNIGLSADWVDTALQQGWSLIPTWVGPQAPCSIFRHKFSLDPAAAYAQGRSEADSAAVAAAGLGLTTYGPGSTLIYYDLEGYGGSTDPACEAAALSFVNGWVERMHELGNPAGVYGAACASSVRKWANLPNVPDDIWVAHWIYDEYNPDATAYDVLCLSNTLWPDEANRRLRQYTGDHYETWGGKRMAIDSNVADGQVVSLPVVSGTLTTQPISLLAAPAVQGLWAFSDQQAWLLVDGSLYQSGDAGQSWEDLSPAGAAVQAAFFLDASQGWLVSGDENGSLQILRTADAGASWQALASLASPWQVAGIQAASLDYVSPQEGWLAVRYLTSANFNLGALYHTRDGGQTWEELSLPGGGPVDFTSPSQGWTLAGAEGDVFYQSGDGGLTWQAAESAPQTGVLNLPGALAGSLPDIAGVSLAGDQLAWAFTRSGSCENGQCTSLTGLWRTTDGGISWQAVALPAAK